MSLRGFTCGRHLKSEQQLRKSTKILVHESLIPSLINQTTTLNNWPLIVTFNVNESMLHFCRLQTTCPSLTTPDFSVNTDVFTINVHMFFKFFICLLLLILVFALRYHNGIMYQCVNTVNSYSTRFVCFSHSDFKAHERIKV